MYFIYSIQSKNNHYIDITLIEYFLRVQIPHLDQASTIQGSFLYRSDAPSSDILQED